MTDSAGAAAPAGWHRDPFGRFEWRYWDGAQWTDHVATAGSQSTDPPTGEVASADRSVFDAPQVGFFYQGDEMPDGWPVYVGERTVAAVRVTNRFFGADEYFLEDTAAFPLLMVHPTPAHFDSGYEILDPQVGYLGLVNLTQGNRQSSLYDVLDARNQLAARATVETSRHAVETCVVVDVSGRQIARVVQGKERTGLLSSRAWLTLERDPAVVDPLRILLVALPLALHDDLSQRATTYNAGHHAGSTRRVHDRWDPL